MQLSDFDTSTNLVELFLARADRLADKPFLWAKRDGRWQPQSWAQVAQQVCRLSAALVRMGFVPGERIMLVSENRPEWLIADMAIMAAGCITVPAYTTNTERDHLHVLDNSGARGVIVSSAKLAKPLLPAMLRAGQAAHVIAMEPLGVTQAGMLEYHEWDTLLAAEEAQAARAGVEARICGITRADTACLIYTSGTGGAPRGVMQHHGAILHNVAGAAHVLVEDFGWGEEVFLSFLPLSHAYEHTAGQFLPIGMGAQIYYAESLDKLAANIEEVAPSIMIVVPRLFEVLRARIIKQIEKQGALAQWLMEKAIHLASRRARGEKHLLDGALDLLLERTLRPKVRARFGGKVKALVSGGAPLNPDIGVFFDAMGLTLLQGYGQTECGPVASVNRPSAGIRMDTVGPPLHATRIRIAPDGEILIAGELVMKGYWRAEAETARVLQGGWLHTGDIGHIDAAGRIVITDRKKDMIVNDKGDNISPQKVEGMLTLQSEIAQAMVAGDRRPYVVGLIVPDAEWALEWARGQGVPFDMKALQDLPAFRATLREAIDRVNADLSVIEKVRQFTFADEPFGIENEEMTPSLKIRRHKLRERYGARMDGLYKG
ncbi:MAG TPA: AMP-dependent synthetase/ligase [Novosphingobium sp.]|nr:AMP-dependent synthetase/ligase [Novosphingobium sp.]